MRIPGWKTARQSGRWLRSRVAGRGLILGYHRVADLPRDPFGMSVSPANFAAQLAVLREIARPVSLVPATLTGGAVAVTFDDGYRDNLVTAFPLLAQFAVPATFYVTTGNLGGAYWWDHLEAMVHTPAQLPSELTLTQDGRSFRWRGGDRDRLLQEIYRWLLPWDSEPRQRALDRLRAWAGTPPAAGSLLMSAEEVATLADSELVAVGSHGVSHPVLTRLSTAAQQHEITASKRTLEVLLGRPVRGFSYANGAHARVTRNLVRDAGYHHACTSVTDVVCAGADRWRLPRFWVPDCDGLTFRRWLTRWLTPRR